MLLSDRIKTIVRMGRCDNCHHFSPRLTIVAWGEDTDNKNDYWLVMFCKSCESEEIARQNNKKETGD